MALQPWEIVLIAIFLALIFKPKIVSDLARALGRTVGEFRKTSKESEAAKPQTTDPEILAVAEQLGINTKDRTTEQLREEILARAKKGKTRG